LNAFIVLLWRKLIFWSSVNHFIWFRFTRAIVFSIFPAPKKSINDEIVLITGSGGVLGRALAVEFSKYGAFLCLWDIDEVENQKTYELLYTQYNHRRMVAMKVDITFVINIFLLLNHSFFVYI
jgi:FlaA1/EpsC-like NDP-sugar epimerase